MTHSNTLQTVKTFSSELQSTSSSNSKKKIIEKFSENHQLREVLQYTYSPYIHFGTSSENCKKLNHIIDKECKFSSIIELLENLHNRTYTGHDAIAAVNGFVFQNKQYEDVIYNIIDKDLKTRAGATLINKVIPGLILKFDVALAEAINVLPDFENEEWLGSRKLDGVRCIVRKEHGEISAYSRAGNKFETLELILNEVKNIPGDFVLDGEVCIVDKHGSENFQDVMKEIRRKNHTIKNPKFFIFDYLTLEEFDTQVSTTNLEDRYIKLQKLNINLTNTMVILEQCPIENRSQFTEMVADAETQGYEGIMIRKNTAYKGKRSKDILKVKKFHDAEYIVEGCDFEHHRVVKNGKEILMPMLAQVYITHKGSRVSVGSGFSQEQRIKYQLNPEAIIGKTITVQYFEETQNKDGLYSLRFPVLKHIYEVGRNC